MKVIEFGFFYLIVISIYTKEDFLGLSFALLVDSFARVLHFCGCESLDVWVAVFAKLDQSFDFRIDEVVDAILDLAD